MAFKMKAGKEGPMKKNFPSAFKQTKEVPLTIEDRQASMDTIAASRFNLERHYTNRSGDASLYNSPQYKADEEASERLNYWPRREGDPDGQEAVKRSQDRLVKGTKTVKGKPTYEQSYTAEVAKEWKDKGGKEAYIKAAKAYNAKKK